MATKDLATCRNELSKFLRNDKMQQQFNVLLENSPHMTAARLARIAISVCNKNPKLFGCSPESIASSLLECGELGLEPASTQALVHLVPFWSNKKGKSECVTIIDYRGYMELAWRTDKVLSFFAAAIYEKEEHTLDYANISRFRHIPKPPSKRGVEKVGAYAYADIVGGGRIWEWMWTEEILKIRDNSPEYRAAKKGGYEKTTIWFQHEDEMFKKTVVRRLFKKMPKSPALQKAAVIDASEKQEPERSHFFDHEVEEEEPGIKLDDLKEAEVVDEKPPEPDKTADKKPKYSLLEMRERISGGIMSLIPNDTDNPDKAFEAKLRELSVFTAQDGKPFSVGEIKHITTLKYAGIIWGAVKKAVEEAGK